MPKKEVDILEWLAAKRDEAAAARDAAFNADPRDDVTANIQDALAVNYFRAHEEIDSLRKRFAVAEKVLKERGHAVPT